MKPMSLPPICSVTVRVDAVSASNCGGFGPGVTFWDEGFITSRA